MTPRAMMTFRGPDVVGQPPLVYARMCANQLCGDPAYIGGANKMSSDESIPQFDSEKHARDAGWVYTNHYMFYDPSKNEACSWVCPKCITEYKEELKELGI